MTEEEFMNILRAEQKITLRGAAIAYILNIISDEHRRLMKVVENNITDINSSMTAAANAIVGEELLVQAYAAMGEEFFAKYREVSASESLKEKMKGGPKGATLN